MLAYIMHIPAPWILWVMAQVQLEHATCLFFLSLSMPPNLFVSSVSSFWWLCFVFWCNGLD